MNAAKTVSKTSSKPAKQRSSIDEPEPNHAPLSRPSSSDSTAKRPQEGEAEGASSKFLKHEKMQLNQERADDDVFDIYVVAEANLESGDAEQAVQSQEAAASADVVRSDAASQPGRATDLVSPPPKRPRINEAPELKILKRKWHQIIQIARGIRGHECMNKHRRRCPTPLPPVVPRPPECFDLSQPVERFDLDDGEEAQEAEAEVQEEAAETGVQTLPPEPKALRERKLTCPRCQVAIETIESCIRDENRYANILCKKTQAGCGRMTTATKWRCACKVLWFKCSKHSQHVPAKVHTATAKCAAAKKEHKEMRMPTFYEKPASGLKRAIASVSASSQTLPTKSARTCPGASGSGPQRCEPVLSHCTVVARGSSARSSAQPATA